jgi:hypothetical protein
MVFLGESYDQNWQATMDGQVLSSHSEANIYGNSWFTNATKGAHEVQISYEPNEMYHNLLYVSAGTVGVLFIVAIFPFAPIFGLRLWHRKFWKRTQLSEKLFKRKIGRANFWQPA